MAVRCHAGSSRRQGHSVLDFLLASPGLRPLPPWRGKVGMGGEKHGMGTPPAFTPTLALPRLRGREKTDRRGSQKLNDSELLLLQSKHNGENAPRQTGGGHKPYAVLAPLHTRFICSSPPGWPGV